jgi:hypothetical protein
MAPAAHLQSLNLGLNNIDDGAIEYFGRYKALRNVTLTLKNFSEQGVVRLRQKLPPNCQLYDFGELDKP